LATGHFGLLASVHHGTFGVALAMGKSYEFFALKFLSFRAANDLMTHPIWSSNF
jgi:hypothetical protein